MSTPHGRISRQAAVRLQAGELILRGFDDDEIIEITECSPSSVKRWRAKVERDGLHGLARKSGSGRLAELTPEQCHKNFYYTPRVQSTPVARLGKLC